MAQDFPDLQFEHITTKEGLSSNSVTSFVEDKQGFIWVGTVNGLNRYDGYRFKYYYHSNTDSNSLVNNAIQRLYCDTKGRIWISTEDGVNCFIPGQNKFINFSSKLKAPFYLKNNSSVGVYEDAEETIWLTNQRDVIYKVSPEITLQEVKIQLPPFAYYNLLVQGYNNIVRDGTGAEWAFNKNRVYQLNKLTKQPEKTFDFSSVLNVQILKMIQDRSGHYFLATWSGGLYRFFPEKNLLQLVDKIPEKVITDMAEWKYRNKDWIACLEANLGLYLLNKSDMASRKYTFIPGDPSSIQGNTFSSFFIDKKDNIWIASSDGINKIRAEQSVVDVIPVTEPGTTNYSIYKAGSVYSFYETDSSIWLSKRYVSTFEYDSAYRLRNFYSRLDPPESSLKYFNNGFAYFFYKRGNELYMTTDSGLVVYDLQKRSSTSFFPGDAQPYTNFRTIVPLDDNRIMIRSYDHGIFLFNMAAKKFIRRFVNGDSCRECLPLRINYLFKSKENVIYLTTASEGKSLFRYDSSLDMFISIQAVNDDKYSMQASDLYGMDEDRDGNLWITSSSGLFVYNPSTNSILQQNNDNELIGGLLRICFDNYGNAWANGSSGIWCYLATKKKWISFNGQDGLPGSDFNGIITKRKNGDIVAGLEGAVAVFHPEKLTEQFMGSPAIITEASFAKHYFPFDYNKAVEKRLVISPGQNSFSVDFAVLNYLSPASTRYYYKLSPLMDEFQVNENGHINFNGLAHGHYTLRVKGGDKAGNLFAEEDTLEITVEPKWYQTNLFKAGCLLLAGLLIFYFVRRRIATIRKEASFKQKIAETEMQALRAQMNPHFIFNSLNSIENFILHNEKRLASDYLNKFARLIRMILDSSRNEVVPLSKDMEALQIYVELEQLRFNNKFSYHCSVDPELLNGDYKVPSLLIQPYVENAIVHGIAHSDKKDLQLTVTVALQNNRIKYTIRDNGVGRKQAAEYNMQNKPGHQSVGLKITEDRVAHFNRQEPIIGDIKITDLYTEDRQPGGTKVDVEIKTR